MGQITRRESIGLLSATALGTMLNGVSEGRAAEPKQAEIILMGPFSMGELYATQNVSLGKCDDDQGPSDKEIADAFNQCQLYVIDKRVMAKTGEWQFAEAAEEYPKLALAGKMHFLLKDRKEVDFKIYLEGMCRCGSITNYYTNPPNRYYHVNFQCSILR